MRIVTAQEMREIDRKAIQEYGIPGLVLMENAGLAVCRVIEELLNGLEGKTVLLICGKGNNGGDGFVAARQLYNRGARVRLLLAAPAETLDGDARVNYDIWTKMGRRVYRLQDRNALQVLQLALMQADIVVDALFGTGFHGVVKDKMKRLIETVNESGRMVVAVDVPSGVEADTGAVRGTAVRADHTVTFGLPKLGLVLEPGADYAGRLHVADISIPDEASAQIRRSLITPRLVREWLVRRPRGAHKGDFGHVLVIGGSRGMIGAACLTAQAALYSGAGLVTLAVPRSLQDVAAPLVPEAMTAGLAETVDGTISQHARDHIAELLKKATVLALGPGLSTHPETVEMVRQVLSDLDVPCVLDADGLNALAASGTGQMLPLASGSPLVLTPHPGEMARLLGGTVGQVTEDRIGTVEQAAGIWGCTVVLKGRPTVVVGDGHTYLNTTGNPGMATGGSGDVLTGVTAALLAQGCAPTGAAAAAVHIHGLAGDLAAAEKGETGLVAGDITHYLPQAFKALEHTLNER